MRAMRRAAFGGSEDEGVRKLQYGAVLQQAVPSGGLGGPQGPVPQAITGFGLFCPQGSAAGGSVATQ
jgi:hypothetical protein